MPSLLDTIPGYRDAVERENAVRDASFVQDGNEVLCGLSVRAMTARHVALLDMAGSPFVCGGAPAPGRVAQFLWVVSKEFMAGDTAVRDAFVARCKSLPFLDSTRQIEQYVEDAFQDAPPGKRAGERIPLVSWVADLVDILASEYGWAEPEILNLPLKRAFQYVRCIQRRHNPKATFFNPSDKVRGEWLKEQNRNGQLS